MAQKMNPDRNQLSPDASKLLDALLMEAASHAGVNLVMSHDEALQSMHELFDAGLISIGVDGLNLPEMVTVN